MKIPIELEQEFLMGNLAIKEESYRNDSSLETKELILKNYTEEEINISIAKINSYKCNYYGETDTWLYQAFNKYPIKNKKVIVYGSTHPWYELMAIKMGAQSVTVSEYNDRPKFNELITYIKPWEIKENYDVGISISSFEHDGLGRYGDPIDPDGDIKTMSLVKNQIIKDGILFLSVPVGLDKVVFNLHRVYGKHRLSKLLKGWERIESFGFYDWSLNNNYNGINGSPYQPIMVLKNL